MTSREVDRFLEMTSATPARLYIRAVQDMIVAVAMDNRAAWNDSRERLGDVARETMGVATILGATESLRSAAKMMPAEAMRIVKEYGQFTPAEQECISRKIRKLMDEGKKQDQAIAIAISICSPGKAATTSRFRLAFAAPSQTIVPSVTFQEALTNMVERTPVTIRDAARRTAKNIARLYGEGLGNIQRIAFVRSAEQAVTRRVQALFTEAIEKGIPELDITASGVLQPGAGKRIKDAVAAIRQKTGAWTESYSRMVFRTNVNTAITAGRFIQGLDPDIAAVMPAVEFSTAGDVDVRGTHAPGDGFIALRRNPIWQTHAPPIDYNCRCSVRDVGLPELRRLGRVRTKPTAGFTRVGNNLYIREDRPPAGWQPSPAFPQGARIDLGPSARATQDNMDPDPDAMMPGLDLGIGI